jgi:hypothetical protein
MRKIKLGCYLLFWAMKHLLFQNMFYVLILAEICQLRNVFLTTDCQAPVEWYSVLLAYWLASGEYLIGL